MNKEWVMHVAFPMWLIGILIGLLIVVLVGCSMSNKKEVNTSSKETNASTSVEKKDQRLWEEIGVNPQKHKPLFIEVEESKLAKEEKQYVNIVKNVPGIHQNGDLFVLVAPKGEKSIRYFTDKAEGNKIRVYIEQLNLAKQAKEGKHYLVARIDKAAEHQIEFIDVSTKKPLTLEENTTQENK